MELPSDIVPAASDLPVKPDRAKYLREHRIKHPQFNEDFDPVFEMLNNAAIQGGVCEFISKPRHSKIRGDKRGAITDFSPGARLRMLKQFHRIDWTQLPKPLFMTLTYPDPVATPDLDKRNMHRKLMARRLERITGRNVAAAWRVEWKPRLTGSLVDHVCPHWHWLILGHKYISMHKVNEAWKETIGWKEYCRTEIKKVDKTAVIPLYLAKYISKDAVPLSLVNAAYQSALGRQYGWLRKDEIPLCPMSSYRKLSDVQRDAMMSLAEQMLPWYDARFGASFTLLGQAAEDFRRILDGESLDDGQL